MTEHRLAFDRRFIFGVVTGLSLGATLSATPAVGNTPFDGNWSVLIVTDAGNCDRAYRYALHIQNGRISYSDPSFGVSGHVDAHGRVHVSVSYGEQHANGNGRLTAGYGQGRWTGRGSTSSCSGHWEAERHG